MNIDFVTQNRYIKAMALPFAVALVINALLNVVLYKFKFWDIVDSAYYGSFRSALFTGFLTAGSFLMAIKSFSISTFKRDMFERNTEYYNFALNNHNGDLSSFPDIFMNPIIDFRINLFCAIISCIATSCMQVTIGFIKHRISITFIIFAITISIILVFKSLLLLDVVFDSWFTFSKNSISKKMSKDQEQLQQEDQSKG